ncbi:MAG: peptide chain release factor N(5)-glutamine methyltransferase [Simkania sp.]|nr:peptide chain release factor N(5)-glutamine methyltransferase [Simkania sp.]
MKTIGEVLTLAAQHLEKKGIERPRREVEDLLAHVLGCKRLDLYLRFDRPLDEKELEALRVLTKRRARGEPIQYILGEVEFYGARISVSSAVLIPRPETEILASKLADVIDAQQSLELWDVCCGAGCLGISLKKKFPSLDVFLSDLSKEALQVARDNAQNNGIEVNFLEGDFLAPFKGRKANIILCNPPYISKKEYDALDFSVKEYEPKLALVGGEDGLTFYRRLSDEVLEYLHPGGRLYLEIGHAQGEAIMQLFPQKEWKKKMLEKDWAGKDRFFFLETE